MWDEHTLTSTLATLTFLTNTDSAPKGIYLKYDVLAVLFSFLFQLLRNLMHLKPDHDPGTAFTSVSEDLCSSGVRHKN